MNEKPNTEKSKSPLLNSGPHIKPLIPETVLDVTSQRLSIVSLFFLIQGWKIYDLYLIKNDFLREALHSSLSVNLLPPEWSFIFKYMFLDGLVVWANSVLRIPKLALKPYASVFLILVLYTVTILLTTNLSFSFLPLFTGLMQKLHPEKELAISEGLVNPQNLLDQSTHFKGKKMIRFLPDSSIKLNPFNQNFCLQNSHHSKVKVPLKYNSSSELDLLQIVRTDFDNNKYTLNYTRKELKKFLSSDYSQFQGWDINYIDERVSYLELEFDKPGYYMIRQAQDVKHKNIRNYRSDLVIPRCPNARFEEVEQLKNVCVDDELDQLSIVVTGVPPLTLVYEEEVNGELSHLPNSIIVPEDKGFHSPLLAKDYYTGKSNMKSLDFQLNDLKNISWAKSHVITVPLASRKIEKAGDFIYTIGKVIDGFGNIVEYSPKPSDVYHFYKVKSHPLPLINFVESKPNSPILIGEEKYLELKASHVSDPSAEGPYAADIKFIPADGDHGKSKTATHVFDFRKPARILAKEPGTYVLESVTSKFCPCKIGTSAINVVQANLPRMHVSAIPIEDNCVGTTGFKFAFDFIGTGPFEVAYKVSRLDPKNEKRVLSTKDAKVLRSETSTFEFDYKPPTEGSYAIEFLALSDAYYKRKVTFTRQEHRYVTYFEQRPRAYFSENNKVTRLNVCHAEKASIDLHLDGKPPYQIAYDLIYPDYRVEKFQISDIVDHQFKIETGRLHLGGEYKLLLRNVTDASNCGMEFRGQEVHIDVRKSSPQLSFPQSESYNFVQGKVLLVPLKADFSQKTNLKYCFTSLDGSIKEEEVLYDFNPADGFPIKKEGIYELLDYSVDQCPGVVSENHQVRAKYLPKPKLRIVETPDLTLLSQNSYQKSTLCQLSPESIELQAIGEAPFIIEYSIKHPSGTIEHKTEQISNKYFSIQLKTSESGNYEYILEAVYDSIYTNDILDNLVRSGDYRFEEIQVKQTVSSLPSARFVDNKKVYQTCVSSLGNLELLEEIPIRLTGRPPFDVKLGIYNEQDGLRTLKLNRIETEKIDLLNLYEHLRIGAYQVSILEVTDSNGCFSSDFDKESVSIQVYDVPKIRHLTDDIIHPEEQNLKKHKEITSYCVGDHINYMLTGLPPFTVYYDFNGKRQKVNVNSNYFKRRASSEGYLSIIALSDSSSKNCLVNFTSSDGKSSIRPDLKARIYDLPSVEISQGDSIEEDIQEGDNVEIIFRFSGTPPFKLTYIRTDLADPNRIVETEVVDNIMEHEYRIWARLEGIYEAIEVQDAYCVARNHK
ncbi:hypothetical protein KL949_000242 [Ogataea haglerorum]|nr:hypothetical protein KL913_000526 [Ogataea haglerorum]KAG7723192.1 hypothetical protein KL949_000242 [Ogataea haglerorum]